MLWTSEQPGLWPHRAQAKKTQEKKAFWGLCQILGVPGGAPWGLRLCVCVHSGGKEPFWIPFSALASLCPEPGGIHTFPVAICIRTKYLT